MANIKIFALGGLGENGKNMYIVEVDSKIFILDAGIRYPDVDMYGVDAVIPNFDYLISRKDDIQGIFVSHGHEDNIGAIPYLLKNLKTRVYGSHFTISLIEANLAANGIDIKNFKLFRINDNKELKFDKVKVKFFSTSHSIPESLGIVIETVDGDIVYCTDFNFVMNGLGNYRTSFEKITDVMREKVLALMCESINASSINRINNDSLLEYNYNSILSGDYQRIFVGAFSTDLIRIQKIIDLSTEAGKRIAIYPCKVERIIDVAMKANYIKINPDLYVDLTTLSNEELANLDNIVIIVTGFRFDPYFTLTKMATGSHDRFKFNNHDKVVLVCPPNPGTERQTTAAINTLCEYDTDLTSFDKTVLRSTHASPDDLKLLYNLTKPEYIIPIKGEYRHMYDHLLVAKSAGYDRDHVILLDNGEVIEFNNGKLSEEHQTVKCGDLLVDGTSVGIVDNDVLEERSILSEEGVIIVHANVNLRRHLVEGSINITSKGFTHKLSDEELVSFLSGTVERILNNSLKKKVWNLKDTNEIIEKEVSNLAYRYTKHRPIIISIINEVK